MSRISWLVGVLATAAIAVGWLWSGDESRSASGQPRAMVPGALTASQPSGPSLRAADSAAASTQQSPPVVPPGAADGFGEAPKSHNRVSAQDVAKVQRALAGGTPDEALNAAQLLRNCARADREVRQLFEARDQQPWFVAKLVEFGIGSSLDSMIQSAQTLQRDCQVFDAAMHARTGALFEQAHAGGAAGSALSYLGWLLREGAEAPPAALKGRLQREIRAEAEAGDLVAVMSLGVTGDPESLGLSAVDRAGFERAWRLIVDGENGSGSADEFYGPMLKLLRFARDAPPELTPSQQAEAEALAQRVYAAHQASKKSLR